MKKQLPKSMTKNYRFFRTLAIQKFMPRRLKEFFDKKATSFVMDFFDNNISDITRKYCSCDYSKIADKKIGNRVWVFWYDGFDVAPTVVKKCIESMFDMEDSDVVLLDKYNLHNFLDVPVSMQKALDEKRIGLACFSDFVRNSLIALYGGFWFDATIAVFDKNFVAKRKDLEFYSIRFSFKKYKHFSCGKWSTFLIGSYRNNPLTSFTSEVYLWYFSNYDKSFDYFLTDYIWRYAYRKIPQVEKMVDGLNQDNSDAFWLIEHFEQRWNFKKWQKMIENNSVQKLSWKLNYKVLSILKNTNYEYFISKFRRHK